MDEIRSALSRTIDAFEAWAEFGVLSLAMIMYIPLLISLGAFLILLPFILIGFGFASPWYVALYIFVIMSLVGGYCYHKYFYGDDSESVIDGRSIMSENQAVRRSRSIMRNSNKRKR